METTIVATGVGGSYTKWQSEPPTHKVCMAKDEETGEWTTVKAYNLLDREGYNADLEIQSGAMGPDNTPFAHDVDFEDLKPEQQDEIREFVISEFKNN